MIRFVCCRYHKFRGHTRAINNTEYNFCHHDYHNDHKNSRGKEGIHYQHNTWTKRAINLEHTCPFYFYAAFDSNVFFVVPGLGNKNHQYHNQQDQSTYGNTFESRRQISQKNEKIVADMGRGKLSHTQIQTAVFQSSGNLLSLS